MKALSLFAALSLLMAAVGRAQTTPAQAAPQPPDTDYSVVSRDAHNNVYQRTTYELTPSGQWYPHVHQYVETATGLNFRDQTGAWQRSSADIEPVQGGAAAVNGQHKVTFAADLATVGAIGIQMPDGQQLTSELIGLRYLDQSSGQSVFIATVTNSIGEIVGVNQVWYENAFAGLKASVHYTYTISSFEQDIVLEQCPAPPESYGLNSATTVLQAVTEFLSPPAAAVSANSIDFSSAGRMSDDSVDFPMMQIGPGRAFLIGDNDATGVPVAKQWANWNGHQVLIEQIPMAQIAAQLQTLPYVQSAFLKASNGGVASLKHVLPARPVARKDAKPMKIASLPARQSGFVLDYTSINSSQTNYVFKGDTTYYISGNVHLYGTNTSFEGGTVIKYTNNVGMAVDSPVTWLSSEYRPIIMTAKDDNSVGETIIGSTGNPTGYYASPALLLTNSAGPEYFRILYAQLAIEYSSSALGLTNGQIINCQNGVELEAFTSSLNMDNMLIANMLTIFLMADGEGTNDTNTVTLQHTTLANSLYLTPNLGGPISSGTALRFTNCILANVTNSGTSTRFGMNNNWCNGQNNGFYNGFTNYNSLARTFGGDPITTAVFPFQPVGAGGYYLTNGSAFHNQGTTNIDPNLLASITNKTTYAPTVYSQTNISSATGWGPSVARDTNSSPDLGYHYDSIDYITDLLSVTNATLTVSNGTVIACYNEPGIELQDGSAIVSIGTPLLPNWFVRYFSVQEEPIESLGGTNLTSGQNVSASPFGSNLPNATFQFSRFATPAACGWHFNHNAANSFGNLLIRDCELYSGTNCFSGASSGSTTATLMNNLFWRSPLYASNNNSQATLSLTNNLIWNASVTLAQPSSGVWGAFDNDFDTCLISASSILTNGFNAYLNCSGQLGNSVGSDIVTNNTLAYQTWTLGNFYQPANSPLINAGNVTANLVGLYEFTTQTNQAKEGTNIVDIGYHYVATDADGNPLDTYLKGTPDYLVDKTGTGMDTNGLPYWWEAQYFGVLGLDPNSDLDRDGNTLLYDYQNGIVPTNAYTVGLLGLWSFDTPDWHGALGQLPIITNDLQLVPGVLSNAVHIADTNSNLRYNFAESDGHTNLSLQNGSVVLWFKPDWSSVDQGGIGPGFFTAGPDYYIGDSGALIGVDSTVASTAGYWELTFDPYGTNIYFTSGDGTNWSDDLICVISWTSNQWHQVALTYSPTNSTLYIDGFSIAQNGGVTHWPIFDNFASENNFTVGNDYWTDPVEGAIDELETFSRPLSAFEIATDFASYFSGPPSMLIQPQNQAVIFSSNAVFTAVAEGSAPLLYQWYFNTNTPLPGAISGQLLITNAQPSEAGNYFVVVTNTYGPVTSSVVTLTVVPAISITNPVNNATFNATGIDVQGTFSTAALQQITVNGVLAFTSSNTFEALDVPLNPGTNIIVATAQDFDGSTNTASIIIIGATNSDGSMDDPVQLQATPSVGFAPLPVTFTIQTNLPGTILQVFYDFNGDGIFDLVTNTIQPLTYTYTTNGEYFPAVTIQTTAGWFSSSGGWNSIDPHRIQINVQSTPVILSTISITDPVDIKWSASSNLYVLSGSTATITEFDANANVIRSLSGIGSNPSGLDVDATGNVYVAITGNNQVWRFNPTNTTFAPDTNFGFGGFIGDTNGVAGSNSNQFNAPFDVAVSPDGGTVSVSDSGNNRIQQFSTNGTFEASLGSFGIAFGQLDAPKGLTYDSVGTLYIVDSGNNRIALVQETFPEGITGTNGTALGQFSGPVGVGIDERNIYIADTGNNRIQAFRYPMLDSLFSIDPSSIRFAISTNLNQPTAVATLNSLTNEMFFVADTGDNRIVLYSIGLSDPTPTWTNMVAHISAGDINGALQYFSIASSSDYREAFLSAGTANAVSAINQIGTLSPVYIDDDTSEFYFTNTIDGQNITFPVDFSKENGVWKILEF